MCLTRGNDLNLLTFFVFIQMLEDVRSQLNQSKANHEADISRLETRLMGKIDESQRSTEKFVSLN